LAAFHQTPIYPYKAFTQLTGIDIEIPRLFWNVEGVAGLPSSHLFKTKRKYDAVKGAFMKYQAIIDQMTLDEKVALCSGADFWNTRAFGKYGIPSITMTDGPHGLRKQVNAADHLGFNNSVPSTCFPTASLTACSWDRDLLREMGAAIGEEALQEGVSIVLGPGVNIRQWAAK
jgi:beta-glucosidase-like glycosyl hydrolase